MNKNGEERKHALLFIMKVSLLQILITLSLVSFTFANNASGQEILDKKLSLNLPSKEIKTVLKTIAADMQIGFTYSNNTLPGKQKITVVANDERLGDVLARIFAPLNISYEVIGKQIVLKRNEPKVLSQLLNTDAQDAFKPVTGTVTGADGAPLQGVSVSVAGTTKGTTTDEKGNFQIQANTGDVLVFSSIGYTEERIKVGESSSINISLKKSDNSLSEVVVTALGIKREAKSLGYSAQKVSGDDIIKADPPSIAQGLMGKVSGLNITVPNGVEGASTRIVIRGNNNIWGNNQPLIVVDNVVVDNEPIQQGGQIQSITNSLNGGTTDVSQPPTDFGSFLNTINPDDLESVNVLKGPTAAALYGARGANGVILIVTKKGSKKRGLGLDYNFTTRVNDPYRFIKMQHEYGNGMTETLYSANPAFYKDGSGNNREEQIEGDPYGALGSIPGAYVSPGVTSPSGGPFYNYIGFPGDGSSWGPKMEGQPLVWWDGTTRPYTANPNIFKSFYKTGNTQTHNVSFSGGGDAGTLRVSYTRTTNDAITYNSNNTTNVFNIGSSINVTKKVKVEASASYVNLNRFNPPNLYAENGNNGGVGYMTVYNLPADYKPIEKGLTSNPDGSQNTAVLSKAPWGYGQQYYWWGIYNNTTTLTQNQFVGSIALNAEILPWLSAAGNVGLNYYTNQFETTKHPTDAAGLLGSYSNDLSRTLTENLDGRLVAHKENLFKDINASFSVGARRYYNNLYDLSASNPGPFNYPFVYNLSNYAGSATNYPRPTENRNEMEINSVYGLLNLSYKNFLFLDASGTNDWSSTLRPSNWSFFYPSASLSFVFTDAFDLGSIKDWLSYGKVRISQASSANAYLPYQNGLVYNSSNVPGFQTGLSVPTIFPTSISPQRSKSTEVGTDLGFFHDRLNVNFTYYNTYSDHQILNINVANSSGLNQILINSGALRNQGIEFTINAKVVNTKDFSWNVSINAAHNRNKVVSLEPGLNYLPLGSWFGGDGVSMRVNVGDNYGGIYGYDYKYAGGQKVVNLVYADGMNTGNGPVIGSQYATSDSIVKIGDATPKVTGGISQTFRYKNFSLYILADFNIGGQIWSADYATIMGQGMAPETVYERDGHGLPYTFPDGTTGNNGVILPGVVLDPSTSKYEKNTAVVNSWWKYAGNYQSWDNVPIVRTNSVFTNSWGKVREVNLSYSLPQSFVSKTKIFQSLSLSLIGRDLFYLFTKLPDRINPESLVGTTNVQGIQFGGLPGVRSYGFSIKAGF
jgi:iron complex outermembrane receptor protein